MHRVFCYRTDHTTDPSRNPLLVAVVDAREVAAVMQTREVEIHGRGMLWAVVLRSGVEIVFSHATTSEHHERCEPPDLLSVISSRDVTPAYRATNG